jgi:hypothetical protein
VHAPVSWWGGCVTRPASAHDGLVVGKLRGDQDEGMVVRITPLAVDPQASVMMKREVVSSILAGCAAWQIVSLARMTAFPPHASC